MTFESGNPSKAKSIYYALHFKNESKNYMSDKPSAKDKNGKYIFDETVSGNPVINYEYFFMTNDFIPVDKYEEIEKAIYDIMNNKK